MTDKDEKTKRGRPVKNKIKPIPDTAETIARAIFHAADKELAADKQLPEPIDKKKKPAE